MPDSPVERSDLTWRIAAGLAGLAAAMLGAAALVILWAYPDWAKRPGRVEPATTLPGAALQVAPRSDLARLRAEEQRMLTSYGWDDRSRGLVRLPVDRAMDRVLADGIADWPAAGDRR